MSDLAPCCPSCGGPVGVVPPECEADEPWGDGFYCSPCDSGGPISEAHAAANKRLLAADPTGDPWNAKDVSA